LDLRVALRVALGARLYL